MKECDVKFLTKMHSKSEYCFEVLVEQVGFQKAHELMCKKEMEKLEFSFLKERQINI